MVLETTLSDQLRSAVSSAIKAPSVHNTQPWQFRISGTTSRGCIDLYADRARSLAVLDPTGRQLELSCGVALLFLRVSLRAAGLDAAVTLLPDGAGDHLARVDVATGPGPTDDEALLFAAIAHRHVQREAFQARRLEPALLRALRRAAEAEGAWLDVVHGRDDQIELITLLSRADREESRNPAYLEELRSWLRTEPSVDGVPVEAVPAHVERHDEYTGRDFNPERLGEQRPAHSGTPPVDEHPVVVVLGTDGDGPGDHVVAGAALGRVLLRASAGGVAASVLGQVMDLPGSRAAVRSALHLLGEPQTVLRLGYATEATGAGAGSGRRALEDVLLA